LATLLDFEITPQPDETTCGPACLYAIYRYYGDAIPLSQVMQEVPTLPDGGTLAVLLGLHALLRGYEATIYTCDLLMFDPSWFAAGGPVLQDRLREQARIKEDPKLREATQAYLEYLDLGGRLRMEDINVDKMRGILRQKTPIVAGLSATWLYQCPRERQTDQTFDDVAGSPTGHFVIVHGINRSKRLATVADPYRHDPFPGKHHYAVDVDRLVCAMMLGIVTADAKMLIVRPKDSDRS
jgi:hypothetical protein